MAGAPTPPATNIRGICYNAADLEIYRARMLQQELTVATLQCQTASGSRAYEQQYAAFVSKFKAEYAANTRDLQRFVLKHLGEGELFNKPGEMVRQAKPAGK